jgi:hypothetical protein
MSNAEVALRALREDAERTLTPRAAAIAALYVRMAMTLPDLWLSALLDTLSRLAGDAHVDSTETLASFGSPAEWKREAFSDPDADAVRYWVAGLTALAQQHAPRAPASGPDDA